MNSASSKTGVALTQGQINAKHHYRFSYLKSEHWSNLRLAKLASVDAKCKRCRFRDLSNDVHHLRYRGLYDVQIEDLVVLCRSCHSFVHEALDNFGEYIEASKDAWMATMQAAQWSAAQKHFGTSPKVSPGDDVFSVWSAWLRNEKMNEQCRRQYEKSIQKGKTPFLLKKLRPEIGKILRGLKREGIENTLTIIVDERGEVIYSRDMV